MQENREHEEELCWNLYELLEKSIAMWENN
jgi:hypothetical protein